MAADQCNCSANCSCGPGCACTEGNRCSPDCTCSHGSPGDYPAGTLRSSYRNHEVAYKDDDDSFELWIDGRSWAHMAGRVGPGQYYSHLLPFLEYPTAEALTQALIDRKGEAWVDEEPSPGEGEPAGHQHDGGR